MPETIEPDVGDARMSTEQLKELADALLVLSSKSSVLKERDELRALMEENLLAEEVRNTLSFGEHTHMRLTGFHDRIPNLHRAP